MTPKSITFEERLDEAESTVKKKYEKLVERVYGPIIADIEQKALFSINNGGNPEILLNEELKIVYKKGGLYQEDSKIKTILDAAKIYQEDYNNKVKELIDIKRDLYLENGNNFPKMSVEIAFKRFAEDFDKATRRNIFSSIDRSAQK